MLGYDAVTTLGRWCVPHDRTPFDGQQVISAFTNDCARRGGPRQLIGQEP
jgi:hypothetical protein